MVFKNSKKKSYPKLPPEGHSVLINYYADGRTQFNRIFTEKGNMPVGYEEWDDEEHRKYILTFTMLDGDLPLLRN